MAMKRIFNQKGQNKKDDKSELEKQILRINALEVHVKQLLKFENQARSSMFEMSREKTVRRANEHDQKLIELNERTSKSEQTIRQITQFINHNQTASVEEGRVREERLLSLVEERLTAHINKEERMQETIQKCESYDRKLEELNERLNQFEQTVREVILFIHNRYDKAASVEERWLDVEEKFEKKLAAHTAKEDMLQKKISSLESQISKLMEQEQHLSNDHLRNEERDQSDKEELIVSDSSPDSRSEQRREAEEMDSISLPLQMRILALEKNYLLVNEVQAGLLKRVDELIEKWSGATKEEAENSPIQQESVFKTLYIDKLYLDKYEQNNNFEQLGIKSLSGALNIGATYGKEAVPKEITEQVKEDMEKMKVAKEEMEKPQTSTEEQSAPPNDGLSSEWNSKVFEEEAPYTDIVIEDDPSLGEDPV
ncbi:hypothetical protein [Pseudobacillus wudalianchiensis]|uniref:Uncharacterized protein n=1 Tax=Pseudobacillus wudalianchiensis TaxID=1743143 RepID=A0A1B9B771_9BACI|nr:hypothetical protein [Bacillus wudalianchiensis]OCA91945.1 hypothetical protein A8F95_18720 [Bacillus wudalianchiensis]